MGPWPAHILRNPERREVQCNDGFSIPNLAPFDHLQCPLQSNGSHIQYFIGIEILAAREEAGGQEDVDKLIRIARHRVDFSNFLERAGPITHLLGKLPFGTLNGALPWI